MPATMTIIIKIKRENEPRSVLRTGGNRAGWLRQGTPYRSQSTYCQVMQEMAETLKRNIVVFNLDPAA